MTIYHQSIIFATLLRILYRIFRELNVIATMPRLSDTELMLLAERSTIPELDSIHLPDDWRADRPQGHCSLCNWNGIWSDITSTQGRPSGYEQALHAASLELSASDGNLCCAVLLALAKKFSPLVGGFTDVWFQTQGLQELMVSHESTGVEGIYVCCPEISEEEGGRVPPGVKVHAGHPISEPWSEKTLTWAKTHVEGCALRHGCCTAFKSTSGPLPTRLIHIPNDFQARGIRLDSNTAHLPSNTRYAALSHCWGTLTGQECLTTIDNIDAHLTDGIAWSKVPQTFRDAIHYTRRLGLEYIWIDSLCIVQGDMADWETESVHMFDYYSNAYVTLGSTFSTNCNGGFFSERHVQVSRLYLFDVVFKGATLPVYAYRPFYGEEYDLDFAENHDSSGRSTLTGPFNLFKRAWTFQERLTSPRLVLFTENQLVFECHDGRWTQETNSMTEKTLKEKYRRLLASSGMDSSEASWIDLVNRFTILQLSYAQDKLPAFSAVAQQYLSSQSSSSSSHAAEDGYLCGLRKSHLHCDLLWSAINEDIDEHVDLEKQPLCFGETYLAPSWSWAAVPRPTRYEDTNLIGAGRGAGRSTITLLSDNLVFTKAGRLGRAVEGSYIVLQGPVLDCFLADWTPGADLDLRNGGHCLRLKNGWETPNFQFEPDFARGYRFFKTDGEVRLCLLQIWIDEEEGKSALLVLHQNSSNHRYYRIGICLLGVMYEDDVWPYLKGHFQDAPQQILEIE